MTSKDEEGQLICVFGISGVGKTSLIREFVEHHADWKSLTASEILSKRTGMTTDRLRTAPRSSIVSNQEVITEQVRALRRTHAGMNWLLDAHSVIDNDRELVAIPVESVTALKPTRLVFVRDQPDAIAARRETDTSRTRPRRTLAELRHEQDFAFEVCLRYAAQLGLELRDADSTDFAGFAAAVTGSRREGGSMSDHPWDDWIPGVLTRAQVDSLIKAGFIERAELSLLDYSALDLRLTDEAFELTGGCVKPFGGRYARVLQSDDLSKPLAQNSDGSFTLHRRHSYVFRLQERIANLKDTPIYGAATAKSSVGRMDVLARLIVDGMDEYEGFRPKEIGNGDLFLEVTPMTFNVLVRPETSLAQLRLFKGSAEESLIPGKSLLRTVLVNVDPEYVEPTLSVDLSAVQIAGHAVCAYSVSLQSEDQPPIPLWRGSVENRPNPWQYWRFEAADDRERLRIRKDRFYIIRSHEKIRLPKGVAVYCRAIDETIGEMRIHYAGFVHPFFGAERQDGQSGTPLIFEVRGHDVDVSLRHREKMARLGFYRMSEDCVQLANRAGDPYAAQSLQLSQFFAPWPEALDVDKDGNVRPRQ